MNYQTVNKAAREFISSIGVAYPLRATFNAERTWQDGLLAYIVLPLRRDGKVSAEDLVRDISENLGKRPNRKVGNMTVYRWASPATGNIISVTDTHDHQGTVMITLYDITFRAPKPDTINEEAVYNAGKIGFMGR